MDENLYVTLRQEQQARLDRAMKAPIAACSGGSCRQGHSRCQTPSACEVPMDEVGGIVDLCWVIFAVALLAVPLFAAVFFVADNWNVLSAMWSAK